MKNFRSKDRRGSYRSNFGGGDSRRPSLHSAVCDECGKDCQVPFRPSGDKPIYCSDCFERRGGRDSNESGRRPFRKRSFTDRGSARSSQRKTSDRSTLKLIEKIETLNSKLDKIISLLSSPGEKKSKPIENKTKKKPKIKKAKKEKTKEAAEVLTLVEKKDSALMTDNTK